MKIEVEKIVNGQETRTYLIVGNIPKYYSFQDMKQTFEIKHKNKFNDLRLPIESSQEHEREEQEQLFNQGYCFINFRHVLYVLDFYKDMHNSVLDN